MIQTTLQIKSKSFPEFLDLLFTNFPTWAFQNMSSSKNHQISHYHIYSKDKKIRGVLEISHDSSTNEEVVLKIADNRKTDWSLEALNTLKRNNSNG